MEPHTHGHNQQQQQLITSGHNTTWGETSSSLGIDMALMMKDHHHGHHHRSDVIFHDQHHLSSLDHQSVWQSSSAYSDYYYNNYISTPSGQSNQMIISSSPSASSLFFVGSSTAHHHHVGLVTNDHQQTLDHHDHYKYNRINDEEAEEEEEQEAGNRREIVAAEGSAGNNENDEGSGDEELSEMKEMMYKIAAMQPVDIDPSTIRKPKRRNVRISNDPQSVAARHRRERISEKMRVLQRLVPGGTKMDTASMLDEAIRYVKFLKRQIKHLEKLDQNQPHQLPPTTSSNPALKSCPNTTCIDDDHRLAVTMANKKQKQKQKQQCVSFVAAASNTTINTSIISSLHHRDLRADYESSLELWNSGSSTSNKLIIQPTDHGVNNSANVQSQQLDIINRFIR